jgi:hypothetical protein
VGTLKNPLRGKTLARYLAKKLKKIDFLTKTLSRTQKPSDRLNESFVRRKK